MDWKTRRMTGTKKSRSKRAVGDWVKISPNFDAFKVGDLEIVVWDHIYDIMTLDSGGKRTETRRKQINDAIAGTMHGRGFRINIEDRDGKWVVVSGGVLSNSSKHEYPFFDGARFSYLDGGSRNSEDHP